MKKTFLSMGKMGLVAGIALAIFGSLFSNFPNKDPEEIAVNQAASVSVVKSVQTCLAGCPTAGSRYYYFYGNSHVEVHRNRVSGTRSTTWASCYINRNVAKHYSSFRITIQSRVYSKTAHKYLYTRSISKDANMNLFVNSGTVGIGASFTGPSDSYVGGETFLTVTMKVKNSSKVTKFTIMTHVY